MKVTIVGDLETAPNDAINMALELQRANPGVEFFVDYGGYCEFYIAYWAPHTDVDGYFMDFLDMEFFQQEEFTRGRHYMRTFNVAWPREGHKSGAF